jgi:peptidoglycan/xylan/chitin deacetylase (PgdA/CDA1 family)
MLSRRVVFASLVFGSFAVLFAACDGGDGAPTTTPVPTTSLVVISPVATSTAAPNSEARVVSRGDPTRRAVALTFDVGRGTEAGNTAEVLRILREQNVRATFSLTGVWAEQNRDLLFAIAADGHQIINGTYDGRSFIGDATGAPPLTSAERRLALFRTETTVYRYTSRSTKPYARPPDGDLDAATAQDVAAEGFTTIVLWTVDSQNIVPAAAETFAAAATGLAEPGVIYRLSTTRAEDAAALPAIISGLRDQRYALETIEGLLSP